VTIFGPDISHYQSGTDLSRVRAEGCDFVIGKVSEGSSFRDTQWPRTRDEGRAAGLLVVGYHYVRTDNPDAQAATCAAHLGDLSIPVALDWERNGGTIKNLTAVLDAFRRKGLNVRLLYTGGWYHGEVGSPDLRPLGLALWKSRYPSNNGGSPTDLYGRVPPTYWAGLGGVDTSLLQFSSAASIAGRSMDCSAFRGTRDELAALLGGAPQEDDEMNADDRKMLQEVHQQLTALVGPWDGGLSDVEPGQEGVTPAGYNLLQYVLRNNVEIHQALKALHAGRAPGALTLADADREAIAARVADLLSTRLAN
jgi:hypothetical protein